MAKCSEYVNLEKFNHKTITISKLLGSVEKDVEIIQ